MIEQFIHLNYKGIPFKKLTETVNSKFNTDYPPNQISNYCKDRKLRNGLDGKFKKGQTPHNKGNKGIHYPGSEKGWFKKGNIPYNHKPIGSERICSKDGYILVKTKEPRTWELKHRLVWEKHNGEIPQGYAVTFLDGDKLNCGIENLALITMGENARLNNSKLRSDIPEITETNINIIKIKTAILERLKNNA